MGTSWQSKRIKTFHKAKVLSYKLFIYVLLIFAPCCVIFVGAHAIAPEAVSRYLRIGLCLSVLFLVAAESSSILLFVTFSAAIGEAICRGLGGFARFRREFPLIILHSLGLLISFYISYSIIIFLLKPLWFRT